MLNSGRQRRELGARRLTVILAAGGAAGTGHGATPAYKAGVEICFLFERAMVFGRNAKSRMETVRDFAPPARRASVCCWQSRQNVERDSCSSGGVTCGKTLSAPPVSMVSADRAAGP